MNDMEPISLHQEVLDLYGTEEWKEGLNLEFKSGKEAFPKSFGLRIVLLPIRRGGLFFWELLMMGG